MTKHSVSLARLSEWYRGLTGGQKAVVMAILVAVLAVVAKRDWSAEGIAAALIMTAVQVAIYAAVIGIFYKLFGKAPRRSDG